LSQNEVQIDYGHFSSRCSVIRGFPPILKSNVGTVVVGIECYKNGW